MIDLHSHIQTSAFDEDRDETIQRAKDAGMTYMLVVGFNLENSISAITLAKQHDWLYSTVGLHPNSADGWSDGLKTKFKNLISDKSNKVIGVGECGLDFYHNRSDGDEQREVFTEHVKLAKEFDLPLIIHCRDSKNPANTNEIPGLRQGNQKIENEESAYMQVYEILQKEGIKKAVFHCYSGNLEFAKMVWSAGYYTSFTGIVTYTSNTELHLVAKEAPLDKIFTETDCPYLPPQKYKGQRNEPAFTEDIVRFIAEERELPYEHVESAIESSFKKLFFG